MVREVHKNYYFLVKFSGFNYLYKIQKCIIFQDHFNILIYNNNYDSKYRLNIA